MTEPEDEETSEQDWQPPSRAPGSSEASAEETTESSVVPASAESSASSELSAEPVETGPVSSMTDREPMDPALGVPAPVAAAETATTQPYQPIDQPSTYTTP